MDVLEMDMEMVTVVRAIEALPLLFLSDETNNLHLYYFRITWRALTRLKHYFMYCHNFLCSIVWRRLLFRLTDISCPWVISHMMTMSPNLISLFAVTCFTFLGMCASIQLSLVGLLVMSSRHLCDMSWSGVLLISFFFAEIWMDNTMYCLGIMMGLFTIDGCRDYCQVWCVAFFSKEINSCGVIWSPSMNSAGRPHLHVPCPACVLFWLSRSATATLFVNVLTLFTIVSIAAEEPSVEHAKVVLHTSCTDEWLRPVRACLSHSACWCLNVPLASNLSRMSCILCALVMWSMSEAPHMWECLAPSAWASNFCRRRFTNRRAEFHHQHTLPSLKSSGRHIAASLSSFDAQTWLFSQVWLMSARIDVGIAVVASSMAYTRTHSCYARFPTFVLFRASAPLHPFTNNHATTSRTLKTQKSIEATVRSHYLSSVSVGCVATSAKSSVLHSQWVTHHRTASPAQIKKKDIPE